MNNNVYQMMAEFDTIGAAYFIGGFVRDRIMGNNSKDIDIEIYGVSSADIVSIASRYGTVTGTIVDGCGIYNLRMFDDTMVDLCIPRRERSTGNSDSDFVFESDPTMTPQEGRSRVDFTFNALLMDRHGNIVDHFGGINDIENKIIRHVGANFVESPVRVLRGMQFAARFGFTVAPETIDLMRSMTHMYDEIAKERVYEEFKKMFMRGQFPSYGLTLLADSGWIVNFPILNDLIGCVQQFSHHPEGDVFNHTRQVVDRMHEFCVRDNVIGDRRLILMFAAILHDIGKPATTEVYEDGRVTSYAHDQVGADMAREFLIDLRVPNDVVDNVVILVREHMALLRVDGSNTRAIRRFVRRLNSVSVADWARLVEADASGRFPKERSAPGNIFVETARTINIEFAPKNPIIMGRHLIEMGMKPGKEFGVILKAAQEAEDNEEFFNVEDGKEWIKENFNV